MVALAAGQKAAHRLIRDPKEMTADPEVGSVTEIVEGKDHVAEIAEDHDPEIESVLADDQAERGSVVEREEDPAVVKEDVLGAKAAVDGHDLLVQTKQRRGK